MDRKLVISSLLEHTRIKEQVESVLRILMADPDFDPQGECATAVTKRLQQLASDVAGMVLDAPPPAPDMNDPEWKEVFTEALQKSADFDALYRLMGAAQEDLERDFPTELNEHVQHPDHYFDVASPTAFFAAMLHHDLDPMLIMQSDEERSQQVQQTRQSLEALLAQSGVMVIDLSRPPEMDEARSALNAHKEAIFALGRDILSRDGSAGGLSVLCVQSEDERRTGLIAELGAAIAWQPPHVEGQAPYGVAIASNDVLIRHLAQPDSDLADHLRQPLEAGQVHVLVFAGGAAGLSTFAPG